MEKRLRNVEIHDILYNFNDKSFFEVNHLNLMLVFLTCIKNFGSLYQPIKIKINTSEMLKATYRIL